MIGPDRALPAVVRGGRRRRGGSASYPSSRSWLPVFRRAGPRLTPAVAPGHCFGPANGGGSGHRTGPRLRRRRDCDDARSRTAVLPPDGWVVVAVISDKFWPLLCESIGLEDLAARVDLRTNRFAPAPAVESMICVGCCPRSPDHRRGPQPAGRGGGSPRAAQHTLHAVASPCIQSIGMVADVDSAEGPHRVVQGPLRSSRPLTPAAGLGGTPRR